MKTDVWMAILTAAILVTYFFTYMAINNQTKALEGAYLPNLIYSGGNCPEVVYEWQTEFSISFANYGKIPVAVTFSGKGENIEIEESYPKLVYNNKTNSDRFMLVPREYRSQGNVLRYSIQIENSTISNASFSVNWEYSPKRKTLFRQITCEYMKQGDLFKLVK